MSDYIERKWLPTFSELIDRLSIHQLKEVFISEHKEKYTSEMKDIMHDLDMLINQNDIKISARLIRSVIVLSQINTHIWYNESKARRGEKQDAELLRLTHGLNGIRNRVKNIILNEIRYNQGPGHVLLSLSYSSPGKVGTCPEHFLRGFILRGFNMTVLVHYVSGWIREKRKYCSGRIRNYEVAIE